VAPSAPDAGVVVLDTPAPPPPAAVLGDVAEPVVPALPAPVVALAPPAPELPLVGQAHVPGLPSAPHIVVVIAAPGHVHATLVPGVQLVTAGTPLPGAAGDFEPQAEINNTNVATAKRRGFTRISNISGSRAP